MNGFSTAINIAQGTPKIQVHRTAHRVISRQLLGILQIERTTKFNSTAIK